MPKIFCIILIFFFKLFSIFYKYDTYQIIKKFKIKQLFNEYNISIENNNKSILSYYQSLISKYSNKKDLEFKNNPLISIIIPLYNNKNQYILRSLISIEAQTFKNIEIIYIDDFSENDSISLINILKLIDKRIILFLNEKNKGILYSKSLGVRISRGKYVIVLDQDDILLSKNLLKIAYEKLEKYELDILQFKRYNLNEKTRKINFIPEKKFPLYNSLVTQSELNKTKNFLNKSLGFTFNIWDKIIKKNVYINALNFLGKELYNSKIVQREDHIFSFALYKVAQKYMRTNIDGYLYINHNNQITKNINQQKSSLVYDEFTFLDFLYINTNETEEEKNIFFREFLIIITKLKVCIKVNNNIIKKLVFKVCDYSINSKFIGKYKNNILNFCNKFKKLNIKFHLNYNLNLILALKNYILK